MSAPEVDVEDLVIAYLTSVNLVPDGQVAAALPPIPPTPFVLVRRVAGGDDYIVDHATIQIDSFGTTLTAASDTAREVNHAMRKLRPQVNVTLPGGYIVHVYHLVVEQTPLFLEWEPSGGGAVLSRYVARYRIDVRLPSIPGF